MVRHRTVAVDIDDVLFPLVPNLTAFANGRLGLDLSPGDYHTYDFCHVWRIPRNDAVDLTESFLSTHSLEIPPLAGAQDAIAAIRSCARLIVVTSREERIRSQTESWLERHFPAVFTDLVMTGHRYRGRQPMSKGEACRRMRADWLVDDQIEHVESARSRGISAALFGTYPWQPPDSAEYHHRVPEWTGIPDALALHPVAAPYRPRPAITVLRESVAARREAV